MPERRCLVYMKQFRPEQQACRRAEQDDVTEDEIREALLQLDPLWDELFPAEQAG